MEIFLNLAKSSTNEPIITVFLLQLLLNQGYSSLSDFYLLSNYFIYDSI